MTAPNPETTPGRRATSGARRLSIKQVIERAKELEVRLAQTGGHMRYLDLSDRPNLCRFLECAIGPSVLYVGAGGVYYSLEVARFVARLRGKPEVGVYERPAGVAGAEAA